MNTNRKFIYRFLFVWLFFLSFVAINTQPSFNHISTHDFIYKNMAKLNKKTFENTALDFNIYTFNLNEIARIGAHIFVFGCLSLVIYWSLNIYNFQKNHTILLSIVICSFFGLLDEIIQLYTPNRQCRFIDVIKDDIGAFIFTYFLYSPFQKMYHFLRLKFNYFNKLAFHLTLKKKYFFLF